MHIHVFGVVHIYFHSFHRAFALQGEGLVEEVVFAVDGIVDHDDAAQFHTGVHHGEFAHVVEAAAVGALLRQLVDEGILGHLHARAVELAGVDLIDGQLLEVGVVDHEGLALVGIGREGTVAQNLHLVAVVVVTGAVGIQRPLIAQEFEDGVGLLGFQSGKRKVESGKQGCYKKYLFHFYKSLTIKH